MFAAAYRNRSRLREFVQPMEVKRLLVGVLEKHRERAVSAHTVSEDARFVGDHWEVGVHEFRQLQSISTHK